MKVEKPDSNDYYNTRIDKIGRLINRASKAIPIGLLKILKIVDKASYASLKGLEKMAKSLFTFINKK